MRAERMEWENLTGAPQGCERDSKNMRPLRIMDCKYNCITQYFTLVAGK
jgi:hypothetical protein